MKVGVTCAASVALAFLLSNPPAANADYCAGKRGNIDCNDPNNGCDFDHEYCWCNNCWPRGGNGTACYGFDDFCAINDVLKFRCNMNTLTCQGIGAECQADDDCADPMFCRFGSCDLANPLWDDRDCQLDEDCYSGKCNNNNKCDPSSEGEPCDRMARCGYATCNNGVCGGQEDHVALDSLGEGEDCSATLFCMPPLNCNEITYTCLDKLQEGMWCFEKSDCDAGLYCDYNTAIHPWKQYCTPEKQNGEQCLSNEQCESNTCTTYGVCVEYGLACSVDSDCHGSLTCEGGSCLVNEYGECRNTDHCSGTLQCNKDAHLQAGIGKCDRRGTGGKLLHQCSKDSQCDSNAEICVGSRCKRLGGSVVSDENIMQDLPSTTENYGENVVINGFENMVNSWEDCKLLCADNDACKVAHYCDSGSGGSRHGECWGYSTRLSSPISAGCAEVKNAAKASTGCSYDYFCASGLCGSDGQCAADNGIQLSWTVTMRNIVPRTIRLTKECRYDAIPYKSYSRYDGKIEFDGHKTTEKTLTSTCTQYEKLMVKAEYLDIATWKPAWLKYGTESDCFFSPPLRTKGYVWAKDLLEGHNPDPTFPERSKFTYDTDVELKFFAYETAGTGINVRRCECDGNNPKPEEGWESNCEITTGNSRGVDCWANTPGCGTECGGPEPYEACG